MWPGPGEDLCFLSGDWRILQRVDGHRWSVDDLVTAWVATEAPPSPPARILDLGCGIGSVLLLLAWRFVEARSVGIEAQELSVALARRSIAHNGVSGRSSVIRGDLRDPSVLPDGEAFDLVTGTPPYARRRTVVESSRPQCAPCRAEHRGGIEDYCLAAARWLRADGSFVVCSASAELDRARKGAAAAGLCVRSWLRVVPREGKAPLFEVFRMVRGTEGPWPLPDLLVVRDAGGQWTGAFSDLRRAMGMPPCPAPTGAERSRPSDSRP